MKLLQGKFTCGNKKCNNAFTWAGYSVWEEKEPFATPVITVKKNMCIAKEHAAPENGIYFFTLVCPKCGNLERVGFDPEKDLYLGHEEHN